MIRHPSPVAYRDARVLTQFEIDIDNDHRCSNSVSPSVVSSHEQVDVHHLGAEVPRHRFSACAEQEHPRSTDASCSSS